jgi:nucleotide-binding universal stress UspA family protein
MAYKSIIVNLDIDGQSTGIVKLAVELAKRFGARLIGAAAADVPPPVVSADGMVFDGEVMQLQRDDIEKRLKLLHAEFEATAAGSVKTEWRSAVYNPTRFFLDSSRAADLILTGSGGNNIHRAVDIGGLALGAGRPVLVAASDVEHMPAKTVLVAWKDAREARRAVSDALPFLVGANDVVVATVDSRPDKYIRDSAADVAAYLKCHGVSAESEVLTDNKDGDRLVEFARSIRADLVVSGAYGHSRLREWAFGGVTRTLLDESGINRFMSY